MFNASIIEKPDEFHSNIDVFIFEKSQEIGVCSLPILDYDEIIGDSSQEIDNNLMNYMNNLRQRINYTNGNTMEE